MQTRKVSNWITGYRVVYKMEFYCSQGRHLIGEQDIGLCIWNSNATKDPMHNIWLNIKNNCSRKRIKNGNVMQQPMYSYICGINLRSERSLIYSDLLFT